MNGYLEKKDLLMKSLGRYARGDVAVAFSGGVDSTLLLKMAKMAAQDTGRQVYAVTVHTKLHPARELEEAEKICGHMGLPHEVIFIDELKGAGIMENPVDRCYLCKKYLFSRVRELADKLAADTVMEGTNEDDLHVYRPGIRALGELGIVSPLAEAGITKQEVRRLAAEYGLSAASKPSAPCLATRFPYGTALTYEKMEQVEKAEAFLKSFGFYNVRVRVHDNLARLEVNEEEFPKALSHRKEIIACLKGLGYVYVTLDLQGFRSGSMDVGLDTAKTQA